MLFPSVALQACALYGKRNRDGPLGCIQGMTTPGPEPFPPTTLVYLFGLQRSHQYNGKLARVLSAPASTENSAEVEAGRVPVQVLDGSREALRAKPDNLKKAYIPSAFQEICRGDVHEVLTDILSGFPDEAVAHCHYTRQGKTSFGAPQLFGGVFNFTTKTGCDRLDREQLQEVCKDYTAVHVKVLGIEDAVELVILGEQSDPEHPQVWLDVGLPRNFWCLPADSQRRTAALEVDEKEPHAFQSGLSEHFGDGTTQNSHPAFYAFTQSMNIAVRGCPCEDKLALPKRPPKRP